MTIEQHHRLREDLGLGLPQLEQLARTFEHLTDKEFPVHLLATVYTVGNLADLLASWEGEAPAPRAPTGSGGSDDALGVPLTYGILVDPKGVRKSR
jgi:hypothetical protein